MNLPKWLMALIIVLVMSGCIGLGFTLCKGYQTISHVANFALVLTLAAVLAYVYYTYLLAKDAWTPSASFALRPYPEDPCHFAFLIQNHSKNSLNCWCNLNATVYGTTVSLDGFYSGQSSFDLQPFGGGNGHFDVRDILDRADYTLNKIKEETAANNCKKQLYLNIEFWYRPVGSNVETRNPRQPHYFDFTHNLMVADF